MADAWTLTQITLGSLSLVASTIILGSFCCNKRVRTNRQIRPVFCMTLCDLFFALNFVTGGINNLRYSADDSPLAEADTGVADGWVAWSALSSQFFGCGTVLWYFVIAANVHLSISGWPMSAVLDAYPRQHLLVWVYAALATGVPFLVGDPYDVTVTRDAHNPMDGRMQTPLAKGFFHVALGATLALSLALLWKSATGVRIGLMEKHRQVSVSTRSLHPLVVENKSLRRDSATEPRR